MAYLTTTLPQDEINPDKLTKPTAGGVVGGEGQNTQNKQGSGLYTNIQEYIQKNPNQSQNMAQNIASNITNQYGTPALNSAIETVNKGFNPSNYTGTAERTQSALTSATNNPAGLTSQQRQDYQTLFRDLQNQSQRPTETTLGQTDYGNQISDIEKEYRNRLSNLQTDQGINQELSRLYTSQPTQGMSLLDQAILGISPESRNVFVNTAEGANEINRAANVAFNTKQQEAINRERELNRSNIDALNALYGKYNTMYGTESSANVGNRNKQLQNDYQKYLSDFSQYQPALDKYYADLSAWENKMNNERYEIKKRFGNDISEEEINKLMKPIIDSKPTEPNVPTPEDFATFSNKFPSDYGYTYSNELAALAELLGYDPYAPQRTQYEHPTGLNYNGNINKSNKPIPSSKT